MSGRRLNHPIHVHYLKCALLAACQLIASPRTGDSIAEGRPSARDVPTVAGAALAGAVIVASAAVSHPAASATGTTVATGDYTVTITHAGQQRAATVHAPRGYDGTSPLPEVLRCVARHRLSSVDSLAPAAIRYIDNRRGVESCEWQLVELSSSEDFTAAPADRHKNHP